MSIQLNHTIVGCRDNRVSAEFWADILGLDIGTPAGPFIPIQTSNGVTFDFANVPPHITEIQPQHYAFLVSEDEFDAAYAKIQRYRLDHWADPRRHTPGINHNDGGRGVYFLDPAGHFMELITVPYGGWAYLRIRSGHAL
ncbi:VOC family protein [Nocardia donostiensis]|uniref:Glyoxalase n=1 Tax=Nocardia donostiensis TaxID=1538463 RepID=A0A1V2TE73_9NOCA|nr:VOC family protein [Nocardia donostiensis]ONM47806.1 glyoxalase [Nocardia donostiensis]OQS13736.1 glyoxalase [Nocardia donostiensis]OQS22558.1 glyoxalase [Nocardia donostiensis]